MKPSQTKGDQKPFELVGTKMKNAQDERRMKKKVIQTLISDYLIRGLAWFRQNPNDDMNKEIVKTSKMKDKDNAY